MSRREPSNKELEERSLSMKDLEVPDAEQPNAIDYPAFPQHNCLCSFLVNQGSNRNRGRRFYELQKVARRNWRSSEGPQIGLERESSRRVDLQAEGLLGKVIELKERNEDLEHENRELQQELQALLDAKKEMYNRDLKSEIKGKEDKIRELESKLEKEEEQNWELRYRNKDQEDKINTLNMRLRNSIPLDDEQNLLLVAKTALEVAQEKRITELEQVLMKMKEESWKKDKTKK